MTLLFKLFVLARNKSICTLHGSTTCLGDRAKSCILVGKRLLQFVIWYTSLGPDLVFILGRWSGTPGIYSYLPFHAGYQPYRKIRAWWLCRGSVPIPEMFDLDNLNLPLAVPGDPDDQPDQLLFYKHITCTGDVCWR